MNAHTATFGASGTLRFQGTLSTRLVGKVDDPTRLKGHLLLSWAANRLSIPIQDERLFVKVLARTYWPGFALDLQLVSALAH